MKEKILSELITARKALGCISVCDKQNCMNMGFSLDIIDRIITILEKSEVVSPVNENDNERS